MNQVINLSIEARMNSYRLPGKVLKKVNNMPLLAIQIKRCKKSKLINDIIVATTKNKEDDQIDKLCSELGVKCFRGSENDVLHRVLSAHQKHKSDIIVELTGDNPLQDPKLIDECVDKYLNSDFDFVNNGALDENRLYPDGMDVAVFSRKLLEKIEFETRSMEEIKKKIKNIKVYKTSYQNIDNRYREHVILYMKTSGLFKTHCVMPSKSILEWPELSLTVDVQPQLDFISNIIDQFKNLDFSLEDIILLLNHKKKLKEQYNQLLKLTK